MFLWRTSHFFVNLEASVRVGEPYVNTSATHVLKISDF